MTQELGRPISTHEVEPIVAQKFGEVFEQPLAEPPAPLQTVSVVVKRGDHVLTLKRREEKGGFWQIVTGRVEHGESPAAAALREAREETGLRIERCQPLEYEHAFTMDGPVVVHEHAFTVDAPEGEPKLTEHDAYEWLEKTAAVGRMPFAGLKKAIRLATRS